MNKLNFEVGDSQGNEVGGSQDNVSADELEECDENVDNKILAHKWDALFLSMQTVLHVPRRSAQVVVEDLHNIQSFSSANDVKNVREVLLKHKIEVNDLLLQDISDVLVRNNAPLSTTSKKGCLSTDHRRNSYFNEHFSVIQPTEYLYNPAGKDTFVYVSVNKVLEVLLRRTDFLDKIVFDQDPLPGVYKSFQDGKYYKDHKLLGQKNQCISLAFYTDA